MIIANSSLKTLDNSGASLVGCIQVKKKYGRVAKIGSLIIISIKKLRNNTNKKFVRKGNIFLAVLVQTKKKIIRKKFYDNQLRNFKYINKRIWC
jgi:ribosomal protein L14